MKENLTELVFLLDRSGSMSGLENDTIGGYNSFLEKQKESGETKVTTVLFDDKYEVVHNRLDLKKVEPLNTKQYYVRGSTALLDAVGKTINMVGSELADETENDRPSKVIMVITTDGYENASREYNLEKVREMIEHQKLKYSWEFLFMGANIDAVSVARDFGIDKNHSARYCASKQGTRRCFESAFEAVAMLRNCEILDESWKSELDSEVEEDKGSKNMGLQKKAMCGRIMPL